MSLYRQKRHHQGKDHRETRDSGKLHRDSQKEHSCLKIPQNFIEKPIFKISFLVSGSKTKLFSRQITIWITKFSSLECCLVLKHTGKNTDDHLGYLFWYIKPSSCGHNTRMKANCYCRLEG